MFSLPLELVSNQSYLCIEQLAIAHFSPLPSSIRPKMLIYSFCILLLAYLVGGSQNACTESMCDDQGLAVYFPFHRGDHCSDPGLECGGRQGASPEKRIALVKFFVKHIDYKRQEIVVYHPYNCLVLMHLEIANMPTPPLSYWPSIDSRNITLFHCPIPFGGATYSYQVPCLGGPGYTVYAVSSFFGLFDSFLDLQSCTKMYDVLSVPFGDFVGKNNKEVLRFNWFKPNCTQCEAEGKRCRLINNGTTSEMKCVHLKKPSKTRTYVTTGATLGSFVVLVLSIAVYRVYSADRKEKENRLKIESFLADYKALKPSRYSYADIKRITNQFSENLGQGAYGTVFKGKLSSEFFVAVKLLNNSKGNGEEFVTEVGLMGHIHHVNVVRLVGFCADGYQRALVYEFFPNGSLQDLISRSADSEDGFLGWDKLQGIAIGIAKGIEYLHQGCDQRILHFDIKPHNVLLDHSLVPKISDFGLAKLCSKDQSLVSMTTARGTMGYIAPEVFSRNFGKVSYKSDVYSFGMVLLEMVGGRKNVGSTMENTDEIYYPEWIYNLLEEGDDLRIHIGEEGDSKIPKRLATVGLWCIQWHPVDRPSMERVVQMLEGGENLSMPSNPFVSGGATTTQLEPIAELE